MSAPRTHGLSGTRIYRTWALMCHRCSNPNSIGWPCYGGRGITVCERWLKFENFLADMGPRPAGTSLDRIDNALGYSPENCRWATRHQQANNMRSNRLITAFGKTMTMAEWARDRNLHYKNLKSRLWRGMSIEEALTLPVMKGGWGLSRSKQS